MKLPEYPVQQLRDSLLETLSANPGLIIQAPPGSGKSTLIPLYLLKEGWRGEHTILLIQPRRAAVRALSARLKVLAGKEARIGYITRGERDMPKSPDIIVMTEGIFLRRIIDDPELSGVAAVILDEFHERSLQIDLSWVLLKQSMEAFRDDLRCLIMSATLQSLDDANIDFPRLNARGRLYNVDIRYRPRPRNLPPALHAAGTALNWMESRSEGSLLCFLPGEGEIRSAVDWITEHGSDFLTESQTEVLPLYGRLPPDRQRRAIEPLPGGRRKIVVATNVAETSLTIEGISCVVDSGLRRISEYDPAIKLERMQTRTVSRASADQRSGRAGRLGPGEAIRLWHEIDRLEDYDSPEILTADLTSLLLDLALWGDGDTRRYDWITAPPTDRIEEAADILQNIGAIDPKRRITVFGRKLSRFPLHPRLAAMCSLAAGRNGNGEPAATGRQTAGRSGDGEPESTDLQADDLFADNIADPEADFTETAALLAAILENGDPLSAEAARRFGPDLDLRIDLLRGGSTPGVSNGPHSRDLRGAVTNMIKREASRIGKLIHAQEPATSEPNVTLSGTSTVFSTADLLAQAFPGRIARRREDGSYILTDGQICTLSPDDGGYAPEWIVAGELRMRRSSLQVFLCAVLPEESVRRLIETRASREEKIILEDRHIRARRVHRLGRIELSSTPLSLGKLSGVEEAMSAFIADEGVSMLSWDKASISLRERLEFLHSVLGSPWPPVDDESLKKQRESWLRPLLPRRIGPSALRDIRGKDILMALVPWDLAARIDELAPERYTLPTGSKQTLRYSRDGVTLSARVQQLFGLQETPMIAGRPVEIELLSPARRPVQITLDLKGFWTGSYREVRKEMRGRYPKHYWPEDPLQARATDGVRPPD